MIRLLINLRIESFLKASTIKILKDWNSLKMMEIIKRSKRSLIEKRNQVHNQLLPRVLYILDKFTIKNTRRKNISEDRIKKR